MTITDILQAHAKTDPNTAIANKKLNFGGFAITIEYPKGTLRELKNDQGKVVYRKHMFNDYGFIRSTTGRDGDEVDVILGPSENAQRVYVAHMKDMGPDVAEREDEDKVLLGFTSYQAAESAFHLMYPKNFWGGISVMSVDDFKQKLNDGAYKGKKIHCYS